MSRHSHALAHPTELPEVSRVELLRPIRWLTLGWRDFIASPGPSVAQSLILFTIGWLILLLCSAQIDLFAAAISGFLLVGPIFGAGFYELSRRRGSGERVSLDAALEGAVARRKPLARLGAVLAVLTIVWVVISSMLFERAFGGDLPSFGTTFYSTIFDIAHRAPADFIPTYLITGAAIALVAFALSALAAPMIFDHPVALRSAMLTSLHSIVVNPGAMLLWASVIAVLTAIGFATLLFGLIVVLPVVGHATWHAYRDLIR